METFDALWIYCSEFNRCVPKPDKWNTLHSLLKNKIPLSSGGWKPSSPLILAAWWETTDLEKQERFRQHIEWVRDNNQIEEIGQYLRRLKEEDWHHFGD